MLKILDIQNFSQDLYSFDKDNGDRRPTRPATNNLCYSQVERSWVDCCDFYV
ncbi:hypothetical protein [Calothrix sp. NIES-2098]|uniref:hypothetical protein n=1 Tax=Calothrix sp. NIES-2098 TaxID=1954171 RepID=UPI0030DDA661